MEDRSPVKLYHFLYPGDHYVKHLAPDGQYTQHSCDGQYIEQVIPNEQYLEGSSDNSSDSHSASGYYSNCYSVSTMPLLTGCHGYCYCLQHSDDDDDDEAGNYRQHNKSGLHSSKDSSILSSEFSDVDYLLLPATLSFPPTQEGVLLSGLICDVKCEDVKFKLSPAFALYLIAKHHLSVQFQPGLHGGERKKHLLVMMKNSISLVKRAVKVRVVVVVYL